MELWVTMWQVPLFIPGSLSIYLICSLSTCHTAPYTAAFTCAEDGKGKVAFAVGSVSLIMASVLHVLLFLAAALVIALLVYYPTLFRRKAGCLILVSLVILSGLAVSLLRGNFRTMGGFIKLTFSGQTPRSQVVARAFTTMLADYPWMPGIGLGPGQFSSRAGLIGTGKYFGTPANPTPIPLLPRDASVPFKEHVEDLWLSLFFDQEGNYVHTPDNTSSTYQPFFSWLSIYTEYGLIGVCLAILLLVGICEPDTQPALSYDDRLVALSVGAGALLVILLGLQENYWETPQAILIGLILLKIQYADACFAERRTRG